MNSFDTPPAGNTRYPVAKPELDNDRTSTPHHETATTTLFQGRSVLPSQKVSNEELMKLILSDGLSNDIPYEVHGHVQISNYPGLKILSGNISVTGSLRISECPELRTISANLFVGGSILISACPLLESITGSVTVNADVYAPHMPSLVHLPGTFSIGGILLLSDCSHLRDLSGNFSVQGNAAFSHCKRLRDVSGKFIMDKELDLSYCPHLTNLSGNFSVGSHIDLNHCIRLRFVPDWITSLGGDSKGNSRHVDLTFTGLSDASIDLLHSANMPGVCFDTTNEEKKRHHKIFDNLPEALAFWWDLACSHVDTPQLNLQPEQAEDVLDFLEQLTWTKEYSDKNYQPVLAQRVLQAITLVLMDDRLREEALIHISAGTTSFEEVVSVGLVPLEGMLQDNRLQSYEEYCDEQSSDSSA